MSQLHAFVIVATILIGFLGAIWKMDDRFNIFVRAILFFASAARMGNQSL